MSNRKLSIIVIIAIVTALLAVVPVAARAITQTSIFRNESVAYPDVDICGAGDVMVNVTYNGVWHTTEYTDDDPLAGTFHGFFTMNGTVITVDEYGEVVSNDRFVKTLFHTNVNLQNLTDSSILIINGLRADGGRHRYHLNYHFNLSASGNPLEFTNVSITCP